MGQLQKMILVRASYGILTLFIVSILMFLGVEMLPGDLATQILGQSATEETVAAFRAQLGLDQPLIVRYGNWLLAALQGDLGQSLANGRPVADLVGGRLENTLFLAAFAAVIAVPISLILGVLAALYRNSLFDRFCNVGALASISMPEFFVAYILILGFAVTLGWLPALSRIDRVDGLWEALYVTFLPALTLILVVVAHMMRMTRAAIINLMASPFIEMCRLKGLSPLRIILMHALPNALAPIINVIAINLAYLVVGVVVVEVVFTYPGLGQLLVDSVTTRDFPIVQTVGLFFAGTYILLNMMADILAILSNPRLRHGR